MGWVRIMVQARSKPTPFDVVVFNQDMMGSWESFLQKKYLRKYSFLTRPIRGRHSAVRKIRHKTTGKLADLSREREKVGLQMNPTKTKAMTNDIETPIMIDGTHIQYCKQYVYLGQEVSLTEKRDKEIRRRIDIAWGKFWGLKFLLLDKCVSGLVLRTLKDDGEGHMYQFEIRNPGPEMTESKVISKNSFATMATEFFVIVLSGKREDLILLGYFTTLYQHLGYLASEWNEGDNAGEMSPGSSTENYPAFAHIGLRENPGKNLNQTSPNLSDVADSTNTKPNTTNVKYTFDECQLIRELPNALYEIKYTSTNQKKHTITDVEKPVILPGRPVSKPNNNGLSSTLMPPLSHSTPHHSSATLLHVVRHYPRSSPDYSSTRPCSDWVIRDPITDNR
ncbi:hypothetical protein ANN_14835 [Periplaneta americana]|uniref:Uncharacterized protein n=1 Tax=Periplaneta americana TaxID=6978 RepID=A0ABQ8SXD9_PERAM|nr:hypothetical protein ANN_14835 [Periplaneta americana]